MPLRSLLHRVRPYAQRARDLFPFTASGLVALSGAVVAVGYYGWKRIDLLLLVMGIVGVLLGALCLGVIAVAAIVTWVRLRHEASNELLKLECGVKAETGYRVRSPWYVPLVTISWSWVSPLARVRVERRRGWLYEEVEPQERGLGERIVRRFEVGDAFGLTRIAFEVTGRCSFHITPALGALRRVDLARSISSGAEIYDAAGVPEGERIDMRPYAAGDPVRLILWKVFARSKQLVVRTPERASSPAQTVLAYLIRGDGDEPAAATARVAVEGGVLGSRFVLGADGGDDDATTPAAALYSIVRSASCPVEEGGQGLATFLKRNAQGTHCRAVVFVPARRGPWVAGFLAALRGRGVAPGLRVECVLCTDGVAEDTRRSLLARVALSPSPAGEETPAAELAALVDALGPAHAGLTLVDRQSGRIHAGARLRLRPQAPQARAAVGPVTPTAGVTT